jgi:preprotein translocase subunit SecY
VLNNQFSLLKRLVQKLTNLWTKTTSWKANMFSAFYGTWRFTTVSTTACHLHLSWIQSMSFRFIALWSVFVLSYQLQLCLQSSHSPSGFPIKILYALLLPLIHVTHLILLYFIKYLVSSTNHDVPHYAIFSFAVTSSWTHNILLTTSFFEPNGSNNPGLELTPQLNAILICVDPKYMNSASFQRTY